MSASVYQPTRYVTCAETAKLVRAALKAAFPGTKFSVRSDTYAGGASIDIRWTDGPTSYAVDRTVNQYKGATFDGMIDLKSSVYHEVDGQRIRYGSDFIMTQRQLSAAFLSWAAVTFCEVWGYDVPDVIDSEWGAHVQHVDVMHGERWLSNEIEYHAAHIDARTYEVED